VDNDEDGLTDCADPDCLAIRPCAAAAPATSATGNVVLVLLLGLVALFSLMGWKSGQQRA
jgi:hypothetical protein